MMIQNAKLRNRQGLWDISIRDGVIVNIVEHRRKSNNEKSNNEQVGDAESEVLDVQGNLVLPPFIDPHVHLDSTLTAGDPRWNESGTLFEGIERWSERKAYLTTEDVKQRAKTALKWQVAHGIQFVRTHVDVTDPDLVALQAMLEVKEEMAPYVTLQIVAFPQDGMLSYPNGSELVEEALRLGADVVGGIPHFEFTREYGVESVQKAFQLAIKYDRLVDIHCDEIDDEQSRFVEVVAAEADRLGMGEKVTASHTTAMHSYNNAYTHKLFGLLQRAKIHFVANPLINIHLQGRFDTYPKRRGLTRVKEMQEAGLNVCFGHDNLSDPWYPLGIGNMLQVLHMGIHACHLTGYEQMVHAFDLITTNSARTMSVTEQYGLEEGKPGNLIVLDAADEYDALRRMATVRYSIRRGRVISETKPAEHTLYMGDKAEQVTFQKPTIPSSK